MKGLKIRIAKGLNKRLGRRGAVFADRYHGVALTNPRQVRNALAYVLLNARHHAPSRAGALALDPCSSSPCFDGWTVARAPTPGPWCDAVAPASTWLLRVGWRRHGLLSPLEVPGRG